MDRSHDITAAAQYLTIGGKQYEMRPLKWRDFAEAEKWMLQNRQNPLDVAIPRLTGLAEPLQKLLLELAWKDQVRGEWLSRDTVLDWMTLNEVGQIFTFWCWIRQAHPELTMDDAHRLRDQNAEENGDIKPDLGLPEGNCQGRTQESAQSQSLGEASAAA